MARSKRKISKKRKTRRVKRQTGGDKSLAYVINLDKRQDRWKEIQEKFNGSSIKLERISAVEHSDGHIGCGLSHLKIIQMAKDRGLPSVLVFEDDNIPTDNFDTRWKTTKQWLDGNMDKWEIFNGGGAFPYSMYNEEGNNIELKYKLENNVNLFQCNHILRNNWIYYNSSAYDKVLKWSRDLDDKEVAYAIDVYVGKKKYFNTLFIYPFLGIQANGASNIQSKNVNQSSENSNLNSFMQSILNKQKGGDNKKKLIVSLTGGLGNRLFQIFAGAGFAEKWDMDLYVLKEGSKWNHVPEDSSINELKLILPQIKFLEKRNNSNYHTITDSDTYNKPASDIILNGFFQNPSLFPTNPILLNLSEPAKNIIKGINNLYFIHLRLGDYEVLPTFTLDLVQYYKKCINTIKQQDSNAKFLVVSNDMNKAKEYISKNLQQELLDPLYDNNISRLDSLYYMSQCKGGICANSTFSWFGAYSIENKNKDLIFMPSPWHNDNSRSKTEIYPKWATIIDTTTIGGKRNAKHKGGSTIDYNPFIYNKYIVFTLTSEGYIDFTYNLYTSLQKANIPWKLMIVCTDKVSYDFFNNKNIPAVLYETKILINKTNDKLGKFGNMRFMSYNRIKLELIEKVRKEAPQEAQYIVYMDGDIIVFKDFIPYLNDMFSKDVSKSMFFQADDGGCALTTSVACSGFFVVNRKKASKMPSPFEVTNEDEWLSTKEDQIWVNKYLKTYNIPFGYLDRQLFPNGGCMYDGQEEWKTTNPYILHYNFIVGNEKITKMKKNNHWFI